jgi:branched-subunit amino acid transport protein
MIHSEYLILVVGMGLVTYIPRWFPILFLSRRQLPQWFSEWLDLIPVAILSALVFPELVTGGNPRGSSHLSFCPKNQIFRRDGCCRYAAFLDGREITIV